MLKCECHHRDKAFREKWRWRKASWGDSLSHRTRVLWASVNCRLPGLGTGDAAMITGLAKDHHGVQFSCRGNSFVLNILFIFLERREGRQKERERNISVWEKHPPTCCLLHAPDWELGLQPSHVPWWVIEPGIFQFAGQRSAHWATPARAQWAPPVVCRGPESIAEAFRDCVLSWCSRPSMRSPMLSAPTLPHPLASRNLCYSVCLRSPSGFSCTEPCCIWNHGLLKSKQALYP